MILGSPSFENSRAAIDFLFIMVHMNAKLKTPQLLKGLVYWLGVPAVLLLLGGDIKWWQAWVYIGVSFAAAIASGVLVARKNPDLIEERAGFTGRPGTQEWDKVLSPLVGIWMPLLYFIIAGLDKRFHWSPPVSIWISLAALWVSLSGFALVTWAVVANRYFSSVVRIQTDRGQKVVEDGPYHLMRHPGYAGGVITAFMFPLITTSLWALIPVVLYSGLVVVRTKLEDQTLMAEPNGYQEYTRRTRYKMLPGIW